MWGDRRPVVQTNDPARVLQSGRISGSFRSGISPCQTFHFVHALAKGNAVPTTSLTTWAAPLRWEKAFWLYACCLMN